MSLTKNFMTRNVLTATTSTPFHNLVRVFVDLGIHHLPIVNKDGTIRAMVSSTDALQAIHEIDEYARFSNGYSIERQIAVREEMSSKLVTITPDTPITDAVIKMTNHNIHALPVMKGEEMVGILSANDILNAIGKGKLKLVENA